MQFDYVVFRGGDQTKQDLVFGDPAVNAQPGDVWVPFVAVNDDRIVQHYSYDANHNLVYTPPVPSPLGLQPSPLGFFGSIQSDATLTAAQKGVLAGYFGTMIMLLQAGQPAAVKVVWQQIIAAYGPAGSFGTWLTAPLQTLIQNYASAANIALL